MKQNPAIADSGNEEIQIVAKHPKGKATHQGQIKSSKKMEGKDVATLIGDLALAIPSNEKINLRPWMPGLNEIGINTLLIEGERQST